MPDARVIHLDDRSSTASASDEHRREPAPSAGGDGDVPVRRQQRRRAAQAAPAPASDGPPAAHGEWERRIAGALAFARRRVTGEYDVDEFGFDEELNDRVLMAPVRPLFDKYFRIDVRGVANIPDTGGALVVANHSGTLPIDGVMTSLAVLDHHPAHRHLRELAVDLVFRMPFLAPLARKAGHTLACAQDAERLLTGGELVAVYPEGFKGVGKPFSERYRLQRFGRGGFVASALRAGAPIVPCSIVGAEEIYPMIGDIKPLARLLGLPYLPVTPFFPLLGPLGAIPLPSKWIIFFGEPIDTASYGESAADDPMLVFNLTDQVRETIQQNLYQLLMQRRSPFL
jgi:1-acyl-sn-glycerol-3-phosphate acyltransferase